MDGGAWTDSRSADRLQRSHGRLRLAVEDRAGRTSIASWYQSGAAKARAPKIYTHDGLEALLINTAGGLTGGDRFEVGITVGAGACGVFTSQASEKVYRSIGGFAAITVDLDVGEGARGYWVPQDTIFFNRAALMRELRVETAEDAELLIIEPLVFGRGAMGERVSHGFYRERWRISVEGRLVFAEEAWLEGDIAKRLAGPASGGGATAFLTGLYRGPELDSKRDALCGIPCDEETCAGASIVRGVLSFRLATHNPAEMRRWMTAAYERLGGLPPPLAWRC